MGKTLGPKKADDSWTYQLDLDYVDFFKSRGYVDWPEEQEEDEEE